MADNDKIQEIICRIENSIFCDPIKVLVKGHQPLINFIYNGSFFVTWSRPLFSSDSTIAIMLDILEDEKLGDLIDRL
jgi:hypothetical protein